MSNDIMKLSTAEKGDVVVIDEEKALVIDVVSNRGATVVHFERSGCDVYTWTDRDPDVVLIGYGKLESKIAMEPTHLFQKGDFLLRSGKRSTYKIECDALGTRDWDGIAAAVMEEKLLPSFRSVTGVPQGGIPFADALLPYATGKIEHPILIAEDIVTTGGSMERWRISHVSGKPEATEVTQPAPIGVCFIARGKCPNWVTPLLQMTVKNHA